jgi:hypothetical protein
MRFPFVARLALEFLDIAQSVFFRATDTSQKGSPAAPSLECGAL